MIAGIVSFSPHLSRGDEAGPGGTSQFDRAEVETIRMHTRQILSDPDLAARTTFWQWLGGKFSKWEKPDFKLGSGWTKFILWVLIIWCVLTLLAILAHLIWTVRLLVWPNSHRQNTMGGSSHEPLKNMSLEELYKRVQKLAEKGAFAEAISVMIVALLRLLDSVGTIRFHESKTNGDYVREYPSDHVGRSEFRQFVLIFEQAIYGRLHGERQTYSQMNSLMEQIRNCVTQKA
jgi:hypothetical protein